MGSHNVHMSVSYIVQCALQVRRFLFLHKIIYLDRSLHNLFYANLDSLVRGPRVLQDGVRLEGYK